MKTSFPYHVILIRFAMGYALKLAGDGTPLTSMIPPEVLFKRCRDTSPESLWDSSL